MNWEHDYRDFKRRQLSASDGGRGILVAATASPGTPIHTALSSVSGNEWDEVWLWATNTSGSPVVLTIQWGGTTAPNDSVQLSIPAQSGLTVVIPGLALQNAKQVLAFAATGNVVVVHGYVNRYERTEL